MQAVHAGETQKSGLRGHSLLKATSIRTSYIWPGFNNCHCKESHCLLRSHLGQSLSWQSSREALSLVCGVYKMHVSQQRLLKVCGDFICCLLLFSLLITLPLTPQSLPSKNRSLLSLMKVTHINRVYCIKMVVFFCF